MAARPLGEHAALRVLGELAHHDTGQPVRETWSAVRTGSLHQAAFRVVRWPDARVGPGRRLVPRLLALPATATSVSICAGPQAGGDTAPAPTELTVRLAARTPAGLAAPPRRCAGSSPMPAVSCAGSTAHNCPG